MGLRVHVQKIWPSPENDTMVGPSMATVYDAQNELLRSIFGPEAEVRIEHNEQSTYFTSCSSMEAYNNVGMLNGVQRAETDGFDVALIACGNDPALEAARDLVRIPVVSITESAMLLACQLGRRFGIVSMDDRSPVLVQRNLENYRLEDRAVRLRPVRSAGLMESTARWFSDPDYFHGHVVPRFEETARSLIADGADVILTACGNFASFSVHGHAKVTDTEVPIVEAVAAGAHMAKLMGGMYRQHGLTTSKQGLYQGPAAGVAPRMTAPFQSPRAAQARPQQVHAD